MRDDEYSTAECAPRERGANEKYIVPGKATLKCHRYRRYRWPMRNRGGRRGIVDEEGVKCDNLRGRETLVDGKPFAI